MAKQEKKQFVIVHSAYGFDMFISDSTAGVSDNLEGATKFTYGEDNPDHKALIFRTMTGLDEFEARAI